MQDATRRVALLGNGWVEPPVRKPPSMLTRSFRVGAGAVRGGRARVLGERRNASLKVTRPGWVWEVERAAHAALGGEAGRVWRESVLVARRTHLNRTSEALAELQGGTSPADHERLRRAASPQRPAGAGPG